MDGEGRSGDDAETLFRKGLFEAKGLVGAKAAGDGLRSGQGNCESYRLATVGVSKNRQREGKKKKSPNTKHGCGSSLA